MIRCGSSQEVTWVATGEKSPVLCRLDDSHTGDHQGRVDGSGMMLSWPRIPTVPLIVKLEGAAPALPPNPVNAACVIKVNADQSEQWTTEPGDPIRDIQVAAERMRRAHIAGPQRMSPVERSEYYRIGSLLAAAVKRLPPLEPDE